MSLADELQKLADLKKAGALSEAEYEVLKKKVLAGEALTAHSSGEQAPAPSVSGGAFDSETKPSESADSNKVLSGTTVSAERKRGWAGNRRVFVVGVLILLVLVFAVWDRNDEERKREEGSSSSVDEQISRHGSPEEAMIAQYEEMMDIVNGDDEPLKILQELREYMIAYEGDTRVLQSKRIVELQGIEDKGKRADRWYEHALDLDDASEDFTDDLKDFLQDASKDDDVNEWCEKYNKSWKKIEEALRDDKDNELASVSKIIRYCPEEEMGSRTPSSGRTVGDSAPSHKRRAPSRRRSGVPEKKLIAHYQEMTEIVDDFDEPAEGLADLNDYFLDNGAEIVALEHDLRVELEGIEDAGAKLDRWMEYARDLLRAEKDLSKAHVDFIKDEVCDDKDALAWCREYNMGWEKISEKAQEKKLRGVSGYMYGCPEDEDHYGCRRRGR